MNDIDRKNAKKYRKKPWIKKHSAQWRKMKDIQEFGYHVCDHAVLRYLERVLDQPIERYRHERIVPQDIEDQVKNWTSEESTRINVKNYQLRVANKEVRTIIDL